MHPRLVNYRHREQPGVRAGVLRDETVVAIAGVATLADLYADRIVFDAALAGTLDDGPGVAVDDVVLLPPSLVPSAIYFAGFNYQDHVANMEKATGNAVGNDPKGLGLKPWHGLKPRNTLCGPGARIELPTPHVDWEVELAAIIGTTARRVPVERALDHVAGYTVAIDISARDLALRPHTPVESPARMDWIMQKGLENFCPLGPCLAPARDIADPQALDLGLSVNGVVKQASNTRHMIFTVAEAIAHLSNAVTLSPGDIILTGTPAGTGAETGEFLKPGDAIAAWIEGIGELRVTTLPWNGPRLN